MCSVWTLELASMAENLLFFSLQTQTHSLITKVEWKSTDPFIYPWNLDSITWIKSTWTGKALLLPARQRIWNYSGGFAPRFQLPWLKYTTNQQSDDPGSHVAELLMAATTNGQAVAQCLLHLQAAGFILYSNEWQRLHSDKNRRPGATAGQAASQRTSLG